MAYGGRACPQEARETGGETEGRGASGFVVSARLFPPLPWRGRQGHLGTWLAISSSPGCIHHCNQARIHEIQEQQQQTKIEGGRKTDRQTDREMERMSSSVQSWVEEHKLSSIGELINYWHRPNTHPSTADQTLQAGRQWCAILDPPPFTD